MAKEFDGKLLMSNIEYLLSKKDMKFNRLEEKAGISAGYISRLMKDPGASKPSAEFLLKVADALDISIDALVKMDLKALTPTEVYLLGFIDNLVERTIADELFWERQTKDFFMNQLKKYDTGNTSHPLFTCKLRNFDSRSGTGEIDGPPFFTSDTFGTDTLIAGDCFKLPMKNETELYLMDIVRDGIKIVDSDYVKELWIFRAYNIQQCLCSTRGGLAARVESLYKTVVESAKRPKISSDVMNAIDSFMGKFDDEIPF